MLERKAMARFQQWKQSASRQALLVTGARQVGKTFLIREFAAQAYPVVAEFNLVENASTRESLRRATSADDLFWRLSVAAGTRLVPHETLIFIDEVQECPEIVTFIKFLVDRGDYEYVLSGSLLGVELEGIRSPPVGYLTELRMYPLDFEEFCWAQGIPSKAWSMVGDCFQAGTEVPDYLHARLSELVHAYLLVGGMPDAVSLYQNKVGIDQVRTVQDGILTFYASDLGKFAPKDRRLVIKDIFSLIPSQLTTQNRRFTLSSIPDVKRYSQVADEFLWLTMANIALAAYNVTAPVSPLLASESRRLFKLFLADVGLLCSQYPKDALLGILDGSPAMNCGGVYENFVAQELIAHGHSLRYFSNKHVGEVDFMIEDGQGRITAIEVKSGRSYKTHAALDKVLTTPGWDVDRALVLGETNVEQVGSVTYLPAYMAGVLTRQ
ncbi:MAG: ATP-binding protein [Propionibacteriaceae bacterium]|nr:ATP-binding protein [Propionibacteriaceae bacterium]